MNAPRTTITEVEPLAERCVRLTFGDGAMHEVDLADLLEAGGVFTAIRDDRKLFEAVAVDHEFGTIVWPGDIDLDPDVLRGDKRQHPERRYRDESFSLPELRRPSYRHEALPRRGARSTLPECRDHAEAKAPGEPIP